LVDRDAPAARCTAAMPPRPHDVASVANAKRRSRSFNRGSNPSSRDFIARNASSSGTAAEYVGGHNSTDRHAGNSTVSNIHSIGLVITLRLLNRGFDAQFEESGGDKVERRAHPPCPVAPHPDGDARRWGG